MYEWVFPHRAFQVDLAQFDESPMLGKCSRCRPVLEDKGEGATVHRSQVEPVAVLSNPIRMNLAIRIDGVDVAEH
jgi:hypothetical protein